jgi:probable F420-dependent oxidoreductase
VKVGVQLPEVERVVRWTELKEMARLIEAAGFDSIWVGDHLLYEHEGGRRGPWEAWTQLAAVAAVTERVELGPLVAALPFHNPAMLAKLAATVDEISDGRLVFGIGAGWNEVEFRAFGLPYERRVSRFAEEFEIIRRLLSGEQFDFDGEFYRLEGAQILPEPRPGGVPFMIGSNSPRMLSIALPHVAMWNSWYNDFDNSPEGLEPLLVRIDSACDQAGRDPATLERTVALLLSFGRSENGRQPQNPITGSPQEMASVLDRIAELGIGHVQLVLDPITIESIERAAEVTHLLDR